MSVATASRTIKFIQHIGAISTRVEGNWGSMTQRYTGTVSSPTACIPDFTTLNPTLQYDFQCFTSLLNASGESNAEVSDFKVYINGKQIVFDSTTKKSTGIMVGSSLTAQFVGTFQLVEQTYPTGTQRYWGVKILKNLVADCAGVSPTIKMEGKVQLGDVTETASAETVITIAEKIGSGDNTVFISSGNSNGFTINSATGAGSTVILKANVLDSEGKVITNPSTAFSYQWYKLDPTKTGNDPWSIMTTQTGQTLTVTADQVNNEAEYKVIVKQGSNEVGFDVQPVYDEGDDLIIDPHPNPADEAISNAPGGNQSVTYTPTVYNRRTKANDTRTWQFTFLVRAASGTPLNTDNNTPKTSYTVGIAHCQAEYSDVSLVITATSN